MSIAPEQPPRTVLQRVGAAGAAATSLDSAHPRLRRAVTLGVVILIAAFLAFAVASQWRRLPTFAWRFEPGWLVLSAIAFLAMLFVHALGWRLIVSLMGYPMRPAAARAAWAKSLLARYVPTNALLVLSRVTMAGREGVPQRVALASIFYELALQISGAVTVGAYFVIELEALEGQPLRWLVVLVPALALGGLHPAVFHRVADFALVRLGREPLPVSLPFSRVLAMWAFYAASFLVAGVGILAFTQAIHPVAAEDVPSVLAAWGVGFGVAVIAFVVPAGLGAREAGLAGALAGAVPAAVAVAVAVGSRIFVTGIELLFAALAALLGRRAGVDASAPAATTAAPAPPAPEPRS